MAYLYLILGLAGNLLRTPLQKIYQRKAGANFASGLLASFFIGATFALFFFALNGFRFYVSQRTLFYALGTAFMNIYALCAALPALKQGKVSIVQAACVAGAAFGPFLLGILYLDEPVTWTKITGMVLLCLALLPPILYESSRQKEADASPRRSVAGRNTAMKPWLFAILCASLFAANAAAGCLLKLNQIDAEASGAYAFLAVNGLWMTAFSGIILIPVCCLKMQKKPKIRRFLPESTGSIPAIALSMSGLILFSGMATVFVMLAASTLPSSVQFPVLNGGQLILNPFIALLFFREKIALTDLICVIASVLAIIFLLL